MKKRWTLEEDKTLAYYYAMDPNFIAKHDLGRTAKDAGSRRVKQLKDKGVWDHIVAYIKASEVLRCNHTLAFSQSYEAREIAAETLRDVGGDISSPQVQELLATRDMKHEKAVAYLAAIDSKR